MSLFNALCGFTPSYELLLDVLGIKPEWHREFRVRDCFIDKDLDIVLYTRIGGDNRESYANAIKCLQAHPNYIKDYDDDFDSTFAYFHFKAPPIVNQDVWRGLYENTTKIVGTPRERFHRLIQNLNDPDKKDDPEVQKALDISKAIIDALNIQGNSAKILNIHSSGSITVENV